MPDRVTCKYCGKAGLVRRENVIKGKRSITAYYCGACNRSWDVSEESTQGRRENPSGSEGESGSDPQR